VKFSGLLPTSGGKKLENDPKMFLQNQENEIWWNTCNHKMEKHIEIK